MKNSKEQKKHLKCSIFYNIESIFDFRNII